MPYVTDWSSVPAGRFAQAQAAERRWWSRRAREVMNLGARYYFYAGYYAWKERGRLLNPFRVDPSRPANYQIDLGSIQGKRVLDIGCGPEGLLLSLVHVAEVVALDPLIDTFRELQPFGWDKYAGVVAAGAEDLPFDDASFDFVHCYNVLDHVRDADAVVREVVRVLRPGGQLLLACDLRPPGSRAGGAPHPYKWSLDTFEGRILSDFEPLARPVLLDLQGQVVPREASAGRQVRWHGRLRLKPSDAR